jgi:hypothetical protein
MKPYKQIAKLNVAVAITMLATDLAMGVGAIGNSYGGCSWAASSNSSLTTFDFCASANYCAKETYSPNKGGCKAVSDIYARCDGWLELNIKVTYYPGTCPPCTYGAGQPSADQVGWACTVGSCSYYNPL